MPGDHRPSDVYREKLSSLYHGCALWKPEPVENLYDEVSIGDVGYIHNGFFYRMFNVRHPWVESPPTNRILGAPDQYKPLVWDPFPNIHKTRFDKMDYHSPNVSEQKNTNKMTAQTSRDAEGVTYKCQGTGALLSIPYDGIREDVMRTGVFEDYIRDNVVNWYSWSQKHGFSEVKYMEDLILVTGRTLVHSWAAAAFLGRTGTAEISLFENPRLAQTLAQAQTPTGAQTPAPAQMLAKSESSFEFNDPRGDVERHCSRFDPKNPSPNLDQCVFIRGFRAKKRLFFLPAQIRAAAEPRPDEPDNRREDEIQVTGVPSGPKYRDPLMGVLDYIADSEKCPEGTIIIAHDDDLLLVENVETLTADAVEKFLRENHSPVLVENGVAILREDAPPVPDEEKAIFYATSDSGLDGEPVPLIVHPALTKYHLKLEISESVDPDHDLPEEELSSPAVHPPVPSLKLESRAGYPELNIEASGDSPDVGVTVQDVLRTIHEDLMKPEPRPRWDRLNEEVRAAIKASFKERCQTAEERSKSLYRFDYLCGRNRLQILPQLSPDDVSHSPFIPSKFSAESPDETNVAGPSRSAAGVELTGR